MPTVVRRQVVLDTDTYNEVDDQFALAHLLLTPELIDLQAVYAAPFFNGRSSGPADGMERSYKEIHRVIGHVGPATKPPVFRGSTNYLPRAKAPLESEMTADLIERAMSRKPEEGKLTVLAIAAITNVASALLLEPRLVEKVKVVWLGGHGRCWPDTKEFNLMQDVHGARALLESGVELVLVPCYPVTSHLIITVPELEKHMAPFSPLGQYLTDIVRGYGDDSSGWSKTIWDISVSAWAINSDWLKTHREPCPILRDDLTWDPESSAGRHEIQIVYQIDRDRIFADFFRKAKASGASKVD